VQAVKSCFLISINKVFQLLCGSSITLLANKTENETIKQ